MDPKDVKTHVAQIEKAVREKLPPSHLIDLLNSLKKDVVATEALLRETKVGMAVNKLRSNLDQAVANLAREIVNKWKKDVGTSKAPNSQSKKASTASPTATPTSPSKPVAKKPDGKPAGDLSKRNKTADGVNYHATPDKTRNSCIGMVYDGLCIDSEASPNVVLEIAMSVEANVFQNRDRKVDQQYKRRIQSLYLNLKDKKNPGLRRRVVSGDISPERLATMESHEMASEERRKEDEEIQKENARAAEMPKEKKSFTDQLTCGKCREKKVSYTQAQTRSADEPMTTFCTCENCGHMWKFS